MVAKRRFVFVLFAVLLVSGATFWAVSMPRHTETGKAVDGTLDLSGADFGKYVYKLDGAWEFCDGRIYSSTDFANSRPSGTELIDVPYNWDEDIHGAKGYATYRLTVLTESDEPLMLHVPEIAEAAAIIINGKTVHRAGRLGVTDDYTAAYRNAFVTFSPQGGRTEIIVQASNQYSKGMGSLFFSFRMGSEEVLLRDAMLRRVLLAAVLGLIAMMALYHIALFIVSRKERIYVWYILYAAFIILRMSMDGNSLVQLLAPEGLSDFLSRLFMACIPAQVIFVSLFTLEALRIPYPPKTPVWRAVFVLCAIVLLGIMAGELLMPSPPDAFVYLAFLTFALTVCVAVRKFVKARKEFAGSYVGLYVIALLIFFFWGIGANLLGNNTFFVPAVFANLFMTLSQTAILSLHYARSRRTAEMLTERNELLGRLNRTKTEFLQDMSHEMKNPLTVIATSIDYADRQIEKEGSHTAETKAALETAREETQRIGRMVGGMVNLASMSEVTENRKRTGFAALLRSDAESFRHAIEERGNALHIEIEDGLPDVFVESDKFAQVVANLLVNAVQHTESGIVTVSCGFASDLQSAGSGSQFIAVTVADTGCGISPDLIGKIFQRGVSGRGGTGYGLYICQTVVEAHGGAISIESEQGKGTRVTFTVPVYGGQEAGHGEF